MCPLCFSTAALIAGSITSTAGLAAIAIRAFSSKSDPAPNPASPKAIHTDKEDLHG
jgi:hypothetical protein